MTSEQPVNILMVDDHPENLLALEAILQPLGQNLVYASSGKEALKCLLHQDFAAILLDVQMPEMDGFETAALIRGRTRSQSTPIIFLTAIDKSERQVFKGYSLGAVDYLFKPLVPEVLRSKVSVFVELHRKSEEVRHKAAELQRTVDELEHQIGERQRAEAALKQAHDQLEQRVQERTAGLAAANAALQAEIAERQRAEAGLRFLAEASRLLASSLDHESTLASVTSLVVSSLLADWCAIDLVAEAGQPLRLVEATSGAIASAGGVLPPLELATSDRESNRGRTGKRGRAAPPDQAGVAYLRSWEEGEWASSMTIPLAIRGEQVGSISFAALAGGRRYDASDLAVAEDLGCRIAATIDNARLFQGANDALHARDTFLSIAAHELKTPLTVLIGYLDLLGRRAERDKLLDERNMRALQVIRDHASRLNKMISSLLDLSRIETGQLSIERHEVNLEELLRRLADEVKPMLERHTLHLSAPEEPLLIIGDELRLNQVLQNLVQNAIKYSPMGGAIHIALEQRGSQAVIAVQDEGMGIPADSLPQLFSRFYRASNIDSQRISGMGVGLYVVKEIVTLHGGLVEVESKEGEGSTFAVHLPLPAG